LREETFRRIARFESSTLMRLNSNAMLSSMAALVRTVA